MPSTIKDKQGETVETMGNEMPLFFPDWLTEYMDLLTYSNDPDNWKEQIINEREYIVIGTYPAIGRFLIAIPREEHYIVDTIFDQSKFK